MFVLVPIVEIMAQLDLALGRSSEDVYHRRNALFQKRISDDDIREAAGVIGFDTGSWLLAAKCVEKRIPFILDQSIGHSREKELVYPR